MTQRSVIATGSVSGSRPAAGLGVLAPAGRRDNPSSIIRLAQRHSAGAAACLGSVLARTRSSPHLPYAHASTMSPDAESRAPGYPGPAQGLIPDTERQPAATCYTRPAGRTP